MLKHIATVNFALAGVFVLPGLAGTQDSTQGLSAQLDATIASIDYLGEIVKRVESKDQDAIQLLLGATEPRRQNELQSEARLVSLRGDVSRLQLTLDRMLQEAGVDPRIPGIPGPGDRKRNDNQRVARTPDTWTPGSLAPTIGLDADTAGNLKTVLPPLQRVDPSSQRKGDEPVALEDSDFSADRVRQGKLLFRAGRYPESIQLLQLEKDNHEARYWLAQSLRAMDRGPEASDILRLLAATPDAAAFARYAASDLEFMEFERQLAARKAGNGAKSK